MKRESGTSMPWNWLSFIKNELKQYPNAKIKRDDPSVNQLFLEPGNLRPKQNQMSSIISEDLMSKNESIVDRSHQSEEPD